MNKLIALLSFLSLNLFGAVIDYRALNTNDFYTNGYYVSLKPVAGTNVQILPGTGLTFTTNGRVVTITATGTNQVGVTNVTLRAGPNITVTTNQPQDWTVSTTHIWTNDASYIWPSGTSKPVPAGGSGPPMQFSYNGSLFLGTNVSVNNAINNAGKLQLAGFTFAESNEPPFVQFELGSAGNDSYNYFADNTMFQVANKDHPYVSWQIAAQATNSGVVDRVVINADPGAAASGVPGSQIRLVTTNSTKFLVNSKGDLDTIKAVRYSWPSTNGAANQFLTTDGGTPQQLSWTTVATGAGSNSVAVAAGTNIFLVTNTGLVTINVANTNLPVVVAGTNVTVVTNGIEYTVSSTAVGGGGGAIGPGTINQVAKFVATTNVGDSIYQEVATNMWVARSKWDGTAYTNHITNTMVGQWTSPTNWTALDLVSAGPANEFNELHAVHGSSYTTGDWPLKLMDTWSIESPTPTGGHSAGELFPAADDTYIIGDSSHQVKNVYVGTGGIDIGIAATKPALRFHNNFVSTWYGVDGTGSSLAFYRDTGITAAFDRFNNLFVFDVAGNYIGFGSSGVSNCAAFLSTGEAVTNGLVQIGTNSAVASPVPAGIMSSKGSGTDKGGADLVVAGGVSTGTGTSGKILFATSGSAAGSSPTLNGLTNRMEIDPGTGNVTIYSNLNVNGTINGTVGGTGQVNGSNIFGLALSTTNAAHNVGIGTEAPSHVLHIVTSTNDAVGIDSTGTDSSAMLHIKNTTAQGPFFDFWSSAARWGFGVASGGNFNVRESAVGTDPVNGTTVFSLTPDGVATVTGNGVSTTIASNTITTGNWNSPTNTPTDAFVLTATGTTGATAWKAAAGGGGGTNSGPIALAYDGTIVTNVNINAATPVGCVTNAILPYRMTMTTNALFKNPTGMLDGQRITIEFIQDATGSRLAYFDTKYAFGTDITGITLSTTANATDFATFIYHQNADKWRCVGFVRGY